MLVLSIAMDLQCLDKVLIVDKGLHLLGIIKEGNKRGVNRFYLND